MKSISFYLVRFIIKLKGIKKLFSEAPVDYQKLRKGNSHVPSKRNVLGLDFRRIMIENVAVTEILPKTAKSGDVILYCPGGSFVSGPNDFNWKSMAYIVKKTGIIGYMVDYPKAPEHKIEAINHAVDAVYKHFIKSRKATSIILLGGSVGGTLMALLVQRLLKKQLPLPKQLILITPVTDCSMSNPLIDAIEEKDIMNAKAGITSAHEMCAGGIELNSAMLSPLYGDTKGFMPTVFFIAEHDIQRPDAELFFKKLQADGVTVQLEYGKGMPHIYPLLPMSEGKKALEKIIGYININ